MRHGAARPALTALRYASHSRTFWALMAGFAICGATTNGLTGTHFVPTAHDHGMAPTTAAGRLAVVGIFDIAGTIASGWLTDRFDPRLLLGFYYFFRGVAPRAAAGAARRRWPCAATCPARPEPWCSAGCSPPPGRRGTRVRGRGFVRDTHDGTYTAAWFSAAALCVVAAALSLGIRRERGTRRPASRGGPGLPVTWPSVGAWTRPSASPR